MELKEEIMRIFKRIRIMLLIARLNRQIKKLRKRKVLASDEERYLMFLQVSKSGFENMLSGGK